MTLSPWLGYVGGMAAIGAVSRLWVRFKRDRMARRQYQTPLFDPLLLEQALAPRLSDEDDADILAEIQATLAHLNRQAYADEFWSLDRQLAAYYAQIPQPARPTMRRALIRLVTVNDRWLQVVAARTCAALHLPEAAPPLRAILEIGDSLRVPSNPLEPLSDRPVDVRFRQEIEGALASLSDREAPAVDIAAGQQEA